jgi:hypothetical protein
MGGVQSQLNAVEQANMGLMEAVQVNDMTQASQLIESEGCLRKCQMATSQNEVVLAAGTSCMPSNLPSQVYHDQAIALLNQVGESHPDMKQVTDNIAAFDREIVDFFIQQGVATPCCYDNIITAG